MLRTFTAVVLMVITLPYVSPAKAFEEYPTFAEYALREIPVLQTLAEPILKKGTDAYAYRTALKSCAERGVDFAGKYTLCSIKQGSFNFLIDRQSGKVYRIKEARMGIDVRAYSDLLILNSDPSLFTSWTDIPEGVLTEYYTFDEKKGELVFIESWTPSVE